VATETDEQIRTETVTPVESVQKIRLAEVPPVRCSSCFGQYTERTHVDFGAAWNGPAFPDDGSTGVVGGKVMTIDDLVICEDCLKIAAGLIGFEDPGDTRRHVAEAEQAAEELRERLHGALAYVAKLEEAAEARGTLEQRLTGGGGG
jgi:hypothetical protein